MIPRILHYCWFGNKNLPEDSQRYIAQWKKLHPNYAFMLWNESNIPDFTYVQAQLEKENYAFASDYIRLWALYEFGGIYLDTDFELLKPLDDLLIHSCFVAFQYPEINRYCVTNALFGAIPRHPFIVDCLKEMDSMNLIPSDEIIISPELTTKVLFRYGLKNYGLQEINNVTILEKESFYPLSYREFLNKEHLKISSQTMAIHHFHGSWLDKKRPYKLNLVKLLKREFNRLKRFLKLNLDS